MTLGGSFLGQPFEVLPFQRQILNEIYEIDPETNAFVKRTCLVGIPRKNAKTTLGAGAAVIHLADPVMSEPAPLAVSAAGDRPQARLCLSEAARMVAMSPMLSEVMSPYRNEIRHASRHGRYIAVSADAKLQQGLNPSLVIMDEFHVQTSEDMLSALTLGSATRRRPQTQIISTAGHNLETPLGRLYQYGLKVEAGEIDDPSFLMLWIGPPLNADLDPTDPRVWQAFNPLWDRMNHDEFEATCRNTPMGEWIRYRLNGWTASYTEWLPAGGWASCRVPRDAAWGNQQGDDGQQVRLVLGVDAAWAGDSAAVVACTVEEKPRIWVIGHWENVLNDPGWRVPMREIEDAIRRSCAAWKVAEVVCDPYRFERSMQDLAAEGLPIVEFPTNALVHMVPACQVFYEAVTSGTIRHDGNPALSRHLGNAAVKSDRYGTRIVKPGGAGSSRRIDLAVAAVIAHRRALQLRGSGHGARPRIITL